MYQLVPIVNSATQIRLPFTHIRSSMKTIIFTMKYYASLLTILLVLSSSQVQAGAVEKCIDSNGKITYTDKGCKSKETAQDTYLIGTESKKRHARAEKTSVTSFKVSEIGLLTEQASEQCAKQAGKYFTDSHPGATTPPKSEFLSVTDRSIRGDKVDIVLAGVIRYQSEKKSQEMQIQCAASKTRDSEWVLEFKDIVTNPKATAAAE